MRSAARPIFEYSRGALGAMQDSGADDGTRTRDLVLTKDALYQLSYVGPQPPQPRRFLERETGIEPANNSLEGCDSAIELLPQQSARAASVRPHR